MPWTSVLSPRAYSGDPADFADDPVYHVILKTTDGSAHPNWKYDLTRPDEYEAGDFPHWHSTNPRIVRIERDQVLGIWNVDTLEKLPDPKFAGAATTLTGSHACWSVDNEFQFYSKGSPHPDCHPLDAGKGLSARVVLERPTEGYPYPYVTEISNVASPGAYPAGTTGSRFDERRLPCNRALYSRAPAWLALLRPDIPRGGLMHAVV